MHVHTSICKEESINIRFTNGTQDQYLAKCAISISCTGINNNVRITYCAYKGGGKVFAVHRLVRAFTVTFEQGYSVPVGYGPERQPRMWLCRLKPARRGQVNPHHKPPPHWAS